MPRRDFLLAIFLLLVGVCEGSFLILAPERRGHAVIEDEFVYRFQAQTLAGGHLSLPSPPLPEFFEAAHLLVVPRFAAKYLPGHALFLAPFEALGIPWFAISLELGSLAALLFLCARAANFALVPALLAGILPLVTEPIAQLFATYLSWTTALPLTAAGILCALRVWNTRSPSALAAGSALAGLLFWTRPFSGIALWAALGLVALLRGRAAIDRKRWLFAFTLPVFFAALATALVCKNVTGNFTELPWTLYARQYTPGDGPGFGPTDAPPAEREIPAHLRAMFASQHAERERYTFAAALRKIPSRLRETAELEPSGILWPLALAAAIFTFAPLAPALAFALIFFLLQLTFYAPTPFYLSELSIPLALAIAAAAERITQWLQSLRSSRARAAVLIAASLPAIVLLVSAVTSLQSLAARVTSRTWLLAPYESALAPAAAAHGLVFIRYPQGADPNLELGYNDADLQHAPLIRARDLGARNPELVAAFRERPAFLFDVAARTLTPLDPQPPKSPR